MKEIKLPREWIEYIYRELRGSGYLGGYSVGPKGTEWVEAGGISFIPDDEPQEDATPTLSDFLALQRRVDELERIVSNHDEDIGNCASLSQF
jgi:hypothetical protein